MPVIGESIKEVTLTKWIKKDGEWVDRDEVIAELESEKATFEINAEKAGILHTMAKEDDTLQIGDVVCTIDDTAGKACCKMHLRKGQKKRLKHQSPKTKARKRPLRSNKSRKVITPEENQPRKKKI